MTSLITPMCPGFFHVGHKESGTLLIRDCSPADSNVSGGWNGGQERLWREGRRGTGRGWSEGTKLWLAGSKKPWCAP
jgi:hypothetical protein